MSTLVQLHADLDDANCDGQTATQIPRHLRGKPRADFDLDGVYSKLAGALTRSMLKAILTIAGPVDVGDQGMR